MEREVRNNSGGAAGNLPVGNSYSKSAMEHKANSNLKNLGNDRQGHRQWHDRFIDAMTQVHRDYRIVSQIIVNAVEMEKLPMGGLMNGRNVSMKGR